MVEEQHLIAAEHLDNNKVAVGQFFAGNVPSDLTKSRSTSLSDNQNVSERTILYSQS